MNFLKIIMMGLLLASLSGVAVAKDNTTNYGDTGDQLTSSQQVVIVFDASGSMDGAKLDYAKRALKGAISKLPSDTNIALLVFGANGEHQTVPFGRIDYARLQSAIDNIRAGGGTPLGEYLSRAHKVLVDHPSRYGAQRLVVVTDGEASDGRLMKKMASKIANKFTLNVIGVAMEDDHELKKFAHTYAKAEDGASLESALVAVLVESTKNPDDMAEAYAINKPIPEAFAKGVAVSMDDAIRGQPTMRAQIGGNASPQSQTGGPTSTPYNGATPLPSEGGCGCSFGNNSPVGGVFLFGLAMLAFSGRRRR